MKEYKEVEPGEVEYVIQYEKARAFEGLSRVLASLANLLDACTTQVKAGKTPR